MLSFTPASDSTPDHVMYNAALVNSSSSDDIDPPECRFTETRSVPLIEDASQYYMTIMRFTANGLGRQLPLFIPVIQTGQHNVNLTVYSFTIEYRWRGPSGDVSSQSPPTVSSPLFRRTVHVQYNPQDLTWDVPQQPLQRQQQTGYYYVKNYENWVEACNHALWTAFFGEFDPNNREQMSRSLYGQQYLDCACDDSVDDTPEAPVDTKSILAQLRQWWTNVMHWGGSGPLLDADLAPILSYDGATGLFSFDFLAPAYQVSGSNFGDATLYMNHACWGLFNSFPTRRLWIDRDLDYVFLISPYLTPSLSSSAQLEAMRNPYAASKTIVRITQDRITTDNWSPISEFVFQSLMLPVMNEQTSPPLVFGEAGLLNGVRSGFAPMITDVSVPLTRADDNTSQLVYIPSPSYRLLDLGSTHQAIRAVDVQVYWRNRWTQELVSIPLTSMSSINIKIGFLKKTVGSK